MPPNRPPAAWRPTATPLALLLMTLCAGCATPRPFVAPTVPPIPSLVPEARQPVPPTSCLPTCSEGARREFSNWQTTPTAHALPETPASGPIER